MSNSSNTGFDIKGSCLCGEIQYAVRALEPMMGHCHCSMCRKFHGAAFATLASVKTENFQWISGEALLKSYKADNGTVRKFCGECGSSLIFVPSNDDGKLVEFSVATLNVDIDLKPDVHIFTQYKSSWYDIEDSLPKFREGRKSEQIE